jgi:hypothetical protein
MREMYSIHAINKHDFRGDLCSHDYGVKSVSQEKSNKGQRKSTKMFYFV